MMEAQVGYLYNIASAVSHSENEINTLLKSYYLMRCKDITRGYGLPDKYFSTKIRCPNCCIEWNKNTEINVKSIKLTERQKQRLKSRKTKESKKEYVRRKQDLLHSNHVEQICSFCKHSTLSPSIKPQKVIKPKNTSQNEKTKSKETEVTKTNLHKPDLKKAKPGKKKEINVYANALDVFSLQNKNNALATKEKPKVINNNKKKKDKFAGLCQKAVLASAKHKGKEVKKDKLSLFLKPSS